VEDKLYDNNTQLLGEVEKLLKKRKSARFWLSRTLSWYPEKEKYFAHCGVDRVLYGFTFGHVAAVSSYNDRDLSPYDLLRIYVWNE
jgi:hypothetical protein